jgi:hypothetical protein
MLRFVPLRVASHSCTSRCSVNGVYAHTRAPALEDTQPRPRDWGLRVLSARRQFDLAAFRAAFVAIPERKPSPTLEASRLRSASARVLGRRDLDQRRGHSRRGRYRVSGFP